ncbi:MAG: TldD/PmbA family protein [Oligoflexus sp.]
MDKLKDIVDLLQDWGRELDFWSIRFVEREHDELAMRRGVVEPRASLFDRGFMITVWKSGCYAYGASSRLDREGVRMAFDQACRWLDHLHGKILIPLQADHFPQYQGCYRSLVKTDWSDISLDEKYAILNRASQKLKRDERIVDWQASLIATRYTTAFRSSNGSEIDQEFHWFRPWLGVTAHDRGETERRSFGGYGICRQGGLEVLDHVGYWQGAEEIADEAIALLKAPNCPTGEIDILLAPDQMILQIHESIGHPLEIDRIMGDERNYAGRSFVSPDMFGHYQYGSDLLNISFDPTVPGEYASYDFDDEGLRAEKTYLIKNGVLLAGLGGLSSQLRSGLPGVANARAVGWNRPPIDRMANLNLEPGDSHFEEMVSSIDRGIYMRTNSSWSIDDSRNKFQFGCEIGQMIENGRLTHLVRKPNYRGISANFWRSLSHVGHVDSFEMLGTPFCGKGEPNQAIEVGHASPACVFRHIQVFGGEG